MGGCCTRNPRHIHAALQEENARLEQERNNLQGQLDAGCSDAAVLNAIVEQLWPKLAARAMDVLITRLLPSLQSTLPKALGTVQIDRANCTLGDRPPRITSTDVEKLRASNSDDKMMIRAKLAWNSVSSLTVKIGSISVCVSNLVLDADPVLELVGICDTFPFVRAVRLFFAHKPSITVSFQMVSFMNAALPKAQIQRKIEEEIALQISNAFVLPNSIGIPLVADVDVLSEARASPEGLLTITLLRLLELPRDVTSHFLRVRCGGETFKSAALSQGARDKPYDQSKALLTAPILVCCATHQDVHIELLRDGGLLSGVRLVSSCSFKVEEAVSKSREAECSLPLVPINASSSDRLSIGFKTQWRALLHGNASVLREKDGYGVLSVGVYHATRAPVQADSKLYWVNLACSDVVQGRRTESITSRIAVTEPADVAGAAHAPQVDSDLLTRKKALLEEYGVPQVHINDVLGLGGKRNLEAGGTLKWMQAFHFPVAAANLAKLEVNLKCRDAGGGEEFVLSQSPITFLGTQVAAKGGRKSMAPSQKRRTQVLHTVQVPGTALLLKLQLHLRYLSEPSIWLRCFDDDDPVEDKSYDARRSSSRPAARATTAPPVKFDYEVLLEKRPGVRLGLDLTQLANSLRVDAVSDGYLVAEWNAENEQTQVRRGDNIVSINGVEGSGQRLDAELVQSSRLVIRLQRGAAPTPNTTKDAAARERRPSPLPAKAPGRYASTQVQKPVPVKQDADAMSTAESASVPSRKSPPAASDSSDTQEESLRPAAVKVVVDTPSEQPDGGASQPTSPYAKAVAKRKSRLPPPRADGERVERRTSSARQDGEDPGEARLTMPSAPARKTSNRKASFSPATAVPSGGASSRAASGSPRPSATPGTLVPSKPALRGPSLRGPAVPQQQT
eukprot:TRINITY_DN111243_c0_g1_i1.p1 TRINITY_DN111243_c0_g1~~TRINITY_DN111243_c0_g1_i1.p1  ORF type:complete len:904 (+),score=166.24 TRINITY_DN111243_c0_g1_i1:180-2891(+)